MAGRLRDSGSDLLPDQAHSGCDRSRHGSSFCRRQREPGILERLKRLRSKRRRPRRHRCPVVASANRLHRPGMVLRSGRVLAGSRTGAPADVGDRRHFHKPRRPVGGRERNRIHRLDPGRGPVEPNIPSDPVRSLFRRCDGRRERGAHRFRNRHLYVLAGLVSGRGP